jgi:hypothetical protein
MAERKKSYTLADAYELIRRTIPHRDGGESEAAEGQGGGQRLSGGKRKPMNRQGGQ